MPLDWLGLKSLCIPLISRLVEIVNVDFTINVCSDRICLVRETEHAAQEAQAMAENYLTAQSAAKELGVSTATLYAYVSRGLVRSETAATKTRSRRYRAEDIAQLKARKLARNDPAKVAAQTLQWGAPILDSAISLIAEGRIYYRGYDATDLAQTRDVEEVAALIWLGQFSLEGPPLFASNGAAHLPKLPARMTLSGLNPREQFQIVLPMAEAEDPAAYNFITPTVAYTGARVLRLLVCTATAGSYRRGALVKALQQAWVPEKPAAAKLINAALIFNANNELSVSAFTARCVASAGATLYSVALAAFCAAQGSRTGRQAERVEAFFEEVRKTRDARAIVLGRLRRGERLPGFGHPLFPKGDPRAKLLLEMTADAYPRSPATIAMQSMVGAVQAFAPELHPNMYFARVALAKVIGLSPEASSWLSVLANSVAWIGHAIEEYQSGRIICPRARYTGPLPESL